MKNLLTKPPQEDSPFQELIERLFNIKNHVKIPLTSSGMWDVNIAYLTVGPTGS